MKIHTPVYPRSDVPEWLEVIRLGRDDWRISDSRIDVSSSGRLLGYVEKLSTGRYELVWMTDPMRWGYVETFDAALAGMAQGAKFTGDIAADRDRSVPLRRSSLFRRIRWRPIVTNIFGEDVA